MNEMSLFPNFWGFAGAPEDTPGHRGRIGSKLGDPKAELVAEAEHDTGNHPDSPDKGKQPAKATKSRQTKKAVGPTAQDSNAVKALRTKLKATQFYFRPIEHLKFPTR